MSLRRYIRKYLGHQVVCHTPFGTFHGIVLHCTKHHVILGVMRHPYGRQYPMGPGGPIGPGGPGWGGGWQMAIPLAAILGITAVGMHWW